MGALGVIHANGDFDLALTIRTFAIVDGTIHLWVGGGVVWDSDPAGEVAAVSAVFRDITKHKAAQEALRESEERFRTMADSCPTPMWVTGAEGGLQFVNRAYRRLLGIASDGLAEFNREMVFHPDDAPVYFEAFRQAVTKRSGATPSTAAMRARFSTTLMGTSFEPVPPLRLA